MAVTEARRPDSWPVHYVRSASNTTTSASAPTWRRARWRMAGVDVSNVFAGIRPRGSGILSPRATVGGAGQRAHPRGCVTSTDVAVGAANVSTMHPVDGVPSGVVSAITSRPARSSGGAITNWPRTTARSTYR